MKETKFKQTEVGMIPSDWEVKPLCELYKVHNGLSKGKLFFGHGYPFLSFSVVFNNVFIPNKLENLVDSSKEERASYSINKGDVFITRTSETVDELGMSCVALKDYPNATYNGFCKRLRPNDVEFVNLGYLGFYLRSDFIREWFLKFSTVTTRASLKNDELLSLPLVLPPTIEEQQRIANALSDVDTLIANLEKLIAKKKNIKQGAMQQLLTGKKRLPGFAPAKPTYKQTELGKIPTDWEIIFIKRNYFLKGRIGWQGLKASEFKTEGPYLVTGTDFVNGRVNWETCYHITEKRYEEDPALHVQLNDLLITKDGTVGKVAYIDKKPEKVSLNSHLLIIRPLRDFLNNKYLYYVLNSPFFEIYFNQVQTGTTMASLSQAKISEFSYPLPSFNEQTAIANILSDMDTEISALETKLAKYRTLKTGMMQQLLTGKIRLA